jgi:hypothetical protein
MEIHIVYLVCIFCVSPARTSVKESVEFAQLSRPVQTDLF